MRKRKRNKQKHTNAKRLLRTLNKHVIPRTSKEYFAKPERFQDRWNRVAHVISRMRAEGVSLRKASHEFGVDSRTVVKLGGSALRKRKSGRYAAKASDRLLRVLAIPTSDGIREIALRDSKQASILGQYWDAVQRYLQTGNESSLQTFRGKHLIDANGTRTELLTDPNELNRLGNAGVLSFESLYARVA
jgi:lambda repressor-like predicted transcriptional regulator